MNKKFTKLIAALALLLFIAPPLVGWGQTRTEDVAYTLQPASGSNNAYASNCDIVIDGITWNLTGNSTVQPWRIGGKSLNGVDRNLYSKTALEDNVSKIEVIHGTASGITVNSWTVIVATNANFSNVVSTLTPTFEASATTTITRPDGADWSNCYYKFVYNVTVTGNSNKYFEFTQAKFYKESSGPTQLSAPTLTATANPGKVTLEWTAVNHASSYTIQYADNASFTGATTVTNATSPKEITGLSNGTTYYFKAMSVGDGTNYTDSDYGTAVSATPTAVQLTAPTLTATPDNGKVTLEWTAVDHASSYTIQYADNASFTGATIVTNATSPKEITGLSNGTTYYFKAMSVGDGTNYTDSGYGTAVSATPASVITITQNELIDFTNTYAWYDWSSGDVSGKAYAYKNAGMQFNSGKDGYWIYNSSPIPGTIASVKMTKASGTDRSWTLKAGTSALTTTSDGTAIGNPQTVGTTGATWDVSGTYNYFLLYVSGGSTVISSIEITYIPSTDPIIVASDPAAIEYNAAGGEFGYSITNPATGVSLNAESNSDWITNVAVDGTNSKVTFNTSTNTNYAQRTGTITLSYTGATDKVITITQNAAPAPIISADDVNIAYDATSGSISYTLENATGNVTATVTTGDWLTVGTITSSTVPFTCSANTAATARTATVTLSYTGADNKSVTVTQAGAPYSTIPALFNAATSTSKSVTIAFGGWVVSAVNGSQFFLTDNQGNGLIGYQSSHGFVVNDVLTGTASCNLVTFQGSAELTGLTTETAGLSVAHNGTVSEQTIAISALTGVNTGALLSFESLKYNGTAFEDAQGNEIEPYNALYSYTTPQTNHYYDVKGIYKKYTTSNQDKKQIMPRSANDIVEVDAPVVATITVNPASINATAAGIDDGTLNITYSNLSISDFEDFAIQFYDEDENELNGDDEPDWLMVLTASDNVGGETVYLVSYIVDANTGAARTAYFKVAAFDADNELVYSNLVTINQAAYVPTPTDDDYIRISSLDQLVDGNIVIIAARYDDDNTDKYYAMANTTSGKPSGTLFTSTTNNGNEILPSAITDDEDVFYWVVNVTTANNSTYYTFTNSNGDKIGAKSGTDFVTNGSYTDWTIARGLSNSAAMVGSYTGFVITNTGQDRAFALNTSHNFGDYATSNMTNAGNASDYNFCLDFFVQMPTYSLSIDGYATSQTNGWHLIASPVATIVTPTAANGFITDTYGSSIPEGQSGNYDLYRFDQTAEKEWVNYRQHHQEGFNLESGQGYLYASKNSTTLYFTGQPYNGDGEIELVYSTANGDDKMWGWNLVGNPFDINAEISNDYLMMNGDGSDLMVGESSIVEAMQGVFVQATGEDQTVIFEPQSRAKSNNNDNKVVINISHDRGIIVDRAIVRFGEGRQLPKMQLFENSTKLYIPQDNKDYAIVSAEAQGEMPVNFRANENGQYTLTVNPGNVEMNYLHLIDNITGTEVDLLQEPTYTFNAKTTDYESRFRLVFASSANGNENDNESFAFFSNGNLIVNNNGKATLQVIDITGRILSSETINGACSTSFNVPAGVYMLRLVNGNNVKVQKMVVK